MTGINTDGNIKEDGNVVYKMAASSSESSVDLSMITLRCRRHFTQGKRRRRRRKEEEGGGDTPPERSKSQRVKESNIFMTYWKSLRLLLQPVCSFTWGCGPRVSSGGWRFCSMVVGTRPTTRWDVGAGQWDTALCGPMANKFISRRLISTGAFPPFRLLRIYAASMNR